MAWKSWKVQHSFRAIIPMIVLMSSVGCSISYRKGRRGEREAAFSLIELMIVIVIIAIIATFALSQLSSGVKSANEAGIVKALRALADAEGIFYISDPDGDGKDYELTLSELKDAQGKHLVRSLQNGRTKGYVVQPMETGPGGVAIDTRVSFAFSAAPEVYGKTGDRTFIISDEVIIYQKDLGGAQVTDWPGDDPEASGWTVVGE